MTLYTYDKTTESLSSDASVSLNTGAFDVGTPSDVTALQLAQVRPDPANYVDDSTIP